jgi:hypothetical protein
MTGEKYKLFCAAAKNGTFLFPAAPKDNISHRAAVTRAGILMYFGDRQRSVSLSPLQFFCLSALISLEI